MKTRKRFCCLPVLLSLALLADCGCGWSDGSVVLDGDQLWISAYGCFDYPDGRGGHWQSDAGSNWDDEYREDF